MSVSIESLRARLSTGTTVRVTEMAPQEEVVGVPPSEYEPFDTRVTASQEPLSTSDINEMFAGMEGFSGIADTAASTIPEESEEEQQEEESVIREIPIPTDYAATIVPNATTTDTSLETDTSPEIPDAQVSNEVYIHNRNYDAHNFSTTVTARFSGASWFEGVKQSRITLIGCGGIGSWTALMLARFNPRQIVLYDDDVVEAHNMAGQFFSAEDIGTIKANAVANHLRRFAGYYNTLVIPQRFADNHGITDIVITCLDNMAARKSAFETWKRKITFYPEERRKKCLFVDGRLAAETFQVFAVAGDDNRGLSRYEGTLFSDDEVPEGICSYRQTSFMANMIGSIIGNIFVNFIDSRINNNPIREIPFKTEYMADAMYFKTEM